MSHIILENLYGLMLHRLHRPLGYGVTFRSANPGLHHQLYANGRLVDFTDTPSQRSFEISASTAAMELAVVAVAAKHRTRDYSDELPDSARRPPWVYRLGVERSVVHRPGDSLAVHHDGATGQMNDEPAIQRELWPDGAAHWGWGLGDFGRGGFGIDGSLAPGFGAGAFGLGPLGLNAERLWEELALTAPGTHQIEARVVTRQGQSSPANTFAFDASPPPAPPTTIAPADYDPQTNTLSLEIVN